MDDYTLLRLFVSQAFQLYYFFILIPIKAPLRRNTLIIILWSIIITTFNAVLITNHGLLSFYVRFFVLTLVFPYFLVFSWYAIHKGAKLLFGFLSVELFGNIAIVNGLLASYIFHGDNNPTTDSIARIITSIIIIPFLYLFVRNQYIKMAKDLNRGWWILNLILTTSYAYLYFIFFVPTPIFDRPEYFFHGYVGIALSLLIYAVIFFLFTEIQSKMDAERDKNLLKIQVESLATQSAAISAEQEKMTILRHDMRHQLLIVEDSINNGKINEALAYLRDYDHQLSHSPYTVYCKNMIVNAAVSYYLDDAKKKDILVDAQLEVPETLNINPAELAMVFANGIENAINACFRIEDPSLRKLSLVSRYVQTTFFLEITNSSFDHVKFNDRGIPMTTREGHGTGVLSMIAFAKKHDATLEFSQKDNLFTLRLIIYSA